MAITNEHHALPLMIEAIRRDRLVLPGSRWAFLGNQRLKNLPVKLQSVKPWLELLGVEVVMWDWNGKDGAIAHDLREPVEACWTGWSDVVCNFGTSEHVETDQRQVFATMHDVCRMGGQILHTIPAAGCDRHGFWKYPLDWFTHFAAANQYEVLSLAQLPVPHNRGSGPHSYAVAALRKTSSSPLNVTAWVDPVHD
jgi:hypothetical protein